MDTYRDSFERFCDILPPNDKQQLKRRFYDESFYLCYTDGRVILDAVESEKWHEWEYAMCHLQKRKMIPRVDMSRDFLIHKDKFLSLSDEVKIEDSLLMIKSEPVEHNQKKRLVKTEALK